MYPRPQRPCIICTDFDMDMCVLQRSKATHHGQDLVGFDVEYNASDQDFMSTVRLQGKSGEAVLE